MTKSRLEAFSDGVIAILITIMVLELHTPHSGDVTGLLEILPTVGLYALSFVYLGIYWNNHHHLLHATSQINGTVLWANLHLLFWLSLIPFGMRWMGESGLAPLPTAAYGVVLLLCGVAYTILVRCILACQPPNSLLKTAIGSDRKGKVSIVLYALAVPLAFVNGWLAVALYALVALIWLIPDRRIEGRLDTASPAHPSGAQPNES
jgi:TMEM175 potassium channel family protein